MLYPFFGIEIDEPKSRVWTRIEVSALQRQLRELDLTKRDRWTEDDLATLSDEEQDNFERKAGRLFDSGRDAFLNTIAKAVSAFSNSGGGHIVIGAADDGSFDGITPAIGRDTIRDWIEKQVPSITDYPLADFRVHTVQRATISRIPLGREVVVIDVGDSAAAPHQSKRDKVYYRREGGRSLPAPHFYLELLRQRLTNPALKLDLIDVSFYNAFEPENKDCLFLHCHVNFRVENVGRIVANSWQVNVRHMRSSEDIADLREVVLFNRFPKLKIVRSFSSSMTVGSRAILPECSYTEERSMGFYIHPRDKSQLTCAIEVDRLLSSLTLGCQVATETSPGSIEDVGLAGKFDATEIVRAASERYPEFFTDVSR